MVNQLVALGADPAARTFDLEGRGRTPTDIARERGDVAIVVALLAAPKPVAGVPLSREHLSAAEVALRDRVLDLSRVGGSSAELFALLKARPDLANAPALPANRGQALPASLVGYPGLRPLHYAARRGATADAERLIMEFSANPLLLAEAEGDGTAAGVARASGHADMVTLLDAAASELAAVGGECPAQAGRPPPHTHEEVLGTLFLAASVGDWAAVFKILKWRPDLAAAACPPRVAARLRSGGAYETLLHHAARQGNSEAAVRLSSFAEAVSIESMVMQEGEQGGAAGLLQPEEYALALGFNRVAEQLVAAKGPVKRQIDELKAAFIALGGTVGARRGS